MAFHFTDLVFKITNWSDTRFTYIEKTVLNALATRADENGKCFPGFTCLVSDTGVSRGRLSDAIANIKELSSVEVEVGYRGKFRYALNEDAIIKFGGLDEDDEEDTDKPKVKTIRGKNGHVYTKVAPPTPPSPAEEVVDFICELCEKPLTECLCLEEPPAETFNQMTCPKCEVTSMMSQNAYANHISICTAKPKAAPAPPVAKPVPQKPTVVPPPVPKPVEVPKVQCPMPHCGGLGTAEQVEAHKNKLDHKCHFCKTAYHTKFESSECEDKHLADDKAERKAKEEAAWVAMEPWQRRAKWEKDKATGTRAGWKKFGRWTEGKEFNE